MLETINNATHVMVYNIINCNNSFHSILIKININYDIKIINNKENNFSN